MSNIIFKSATKTLEGLEVSEKEFLDTALRNIGRNNCLGFNVDHSFCTGISCSECPLGVHQTKASVIKWIDDREESDSERLKNVEKKLEEVLEILNNLTGIKEIT